MKMQNPENIIKLEFCLCYNLKSPISISNMNSIHISTSKISKAEFYFLKLKFNDSY